MPSLPLDFTERLDQIHGQELAANILHYLRQTRATCFRVNTLKAQPDLLIPQLEAMDLTPTPIADFSNAYTIPDHMREQLVHSVFFEQGQIYLQDLSSMLAVICLDPQPDENILDLTAAPGSKTTQIAALMHNQGRIAAVEKNKSRFFKLIANLKTQGVTCVSTYLKDGKWVFKHCPNQFDRVLLDAPCSSEGRFNELKPNSFAYWNKNKIKEMSRQQWTLLYSAFQCLKPAGTLIYSTCTFAPEENEMIIHRLLKRFPEQAQLTAINLPINNTLPGLTNWKDRKLSDELSKTIRILPNGLMSGFYIAKITKRAS